MGDITEKRRRYYSGLDADKASIPALGKAVGDYYLATDTKILYFWDGSTWALSVNLASVGVSIVPESSNVLSLGSAAKHWAYLYTRSLYVDPAFGISSDLNPDTQNAYDLGGGTWPWRNIKALNAYLDNLKADMAADAGVKIDGVDISEHKHTAAAGDAPKIEAAGLETGAVETAKIKDLNVTKGKAELGFGRYVSLLKSTYDWGAGNFTIDGSWYVNGLDCGAKGVVAGAIGVLISYWIRWNASSKQLILRHSSGSSENQLLTSDNAANFNVRGQATIAIDSDLLLDYLIATGVTELRMSVIGYFI